MKWWVLKLTLLNHLIDSIRRLQSHNIEKLIDRDDEVLDRKIWVKVDADVFAQRIQPFPSGWYHASISTNVSVFELLRSANTSCVFWGASCTSHRLSVQTGLRLSVISSESGFDWGSIKSRAVWRRINDLEYSLSWSGDGIWKMREWVSQISHVSCWMLLDRALDEAREGKYGVRVGGATKSVLWNENSDFEKTHSSFSWASLKQNRFTLIWRNSNFGIPQTR